ncbi:MAG: hypothetical protein GY774_08145 [Planctomycetes bacterium]|nr:hypothetical protein [Planctomycetota bacterium]
MNKEKFLIQLVVIVSIFAILGSGGQIVLADSFQFNDGTTQEWTLHGAYDPSLGDEPFATNFIIEWSDSFNYPHLPGSDPIGDDQGSLQLYTPGDHGIDNPRGTWWYMQLQSPDLSSSEIWQKASGYSVKIAESMGAGKTTLYANLFVKLYDLDQKRDRYFTNGVAVPLVPNIWNHHRHGWSGLPDFETNFITRGIFINIWGLMQEGAYLNGAVYLDEVMPTVLSPYIYVDDDAIDPDEDGTQERPFDTIQKGIDAASKGQIVIVLDGTYTGEGNRDIEFGGKAISVRSENGPENCTIDCLGTQEEYHRGFSFNNHEDMNSILKGFTILNGYTRQGGAIFCVNSSPMIVNCVIRHNEVSVDGGGIYCEGSNPTIRSCVIAGNKASIGGGIFCDNSDPTVTLCTITENEAGYGGGIGCTNSNPQVNNSILWKNMASMSGPEIALKDLSQSSTLTISYSDVAGGVAAAYIEPGCTLSWASGNIDVDPLLMPDGYSLLPDSPCIDMGEPTADYTDQLDIDYTPRVFNGRVDIGADEFSHRIHNLTQDTYHNTIQEAIDFSSDGDVVSIPDGIYTGAGNRDIYFRGKAITLRSENGPENCIIDCHGTEEKPHRGFSFNYNEDANSILMGLTIMGGQYVQTGGIWCIRSSPTIINCRFIRNITGDSGGGLYCSESNLALINCTFTANTAARGGAISCKESNPTIINCTFTRNTADWGGSIYCKSRSNVVIQNCILWGNIARKNGTDLALERGNDPSIMTVSYSNVAGGSRAVHVGSGSVLNWNSGNIDANPLLTPNGHLILGSPCIDAGTDSNIPSLDRDNENRPDGDASDIGSDEFKDADDDGLPDWWEDKYFSSSIAASPTDDSDSDDLSNLHEYELYSSNPIKQPYYINTTIGNDFYNGLAPLHEGNNIGPKKTIQAGINLARDGDTISVASGTYTGPGNTFLDFGGKSAVLHAPGGPASTSIDCEYLWSSAFLFRSNETPATAVVGLTITNVARNQGRAIVCWNSHPQIRNCVIRGNTTNKLGGALYCYSSMPILADCNISSDSSDSVWIEYGGIHIVGNVLTDSIDWTGIDLILFGDGTLHMQSDVTLNLDDSLIHCNLSGPGMILVDLNSELIIGGDAVVDLGHETLATGQLVCDGLLQLKDNASVINAELYVNRASFEDNVVIANCVINSEAGAPYGQFFVQDNVHIKLDKIIADGDRYLDVDPMEFDCNNILVSTIQVDITEGVGMSYGGLFELRGRDINLPPRYPNEFLYQLESVPDFDPKNWTIDRLELVAGAKLNLTNRFDFQAPYDSGGDCEVLYVKELLLGPNSILNLAFNRLYYENLTMHASAQIVNIPLLGFSLHNISFDDENDFLTRVKHNNFEHLENSSFNRIHIERLEGLEPDPNGMMRMCNLLDLDPESPSYEQIVNAQAKGLFAKSSEDEVLIQFEYLFDGPNNIGELVIYLSDTPELLEHSDPSRDLHYIEVARLPHPSSGRPGSAGSGRFGIFERVVSAGHLNFTRGTRMELELIGPEQTCIFIDDWDPSVLRCTMMCGDVAGALHEVSAEDLLAVISESGRKTSEPSGTASGTLSCADGFFCADGYVTVHDAMAIDFIAPPSPLGNLCPDNGIFNSTPLSAITSQKEANVLSTESTLILAGINQTVFNGELLVIGKAYKPDYLWGDFLSDCLYALDEQGNPVDGLFLIENDRANGKLVRDHSGQVYQINLELGLIQLSDSSSVIVPPGSRSGINEPRYGQLATVYIGFQEKDGMWIPPILDAAFDADSYLYVAPVVVVIPGYSSYSAVAKLQLSSTGSSPYQVVQLFCDSPAQSDYEFNNNLQEIEVDENGYLYVINVYRINENDTLWICDTNTGALMNRLVLNNPNNDIRIPAPIGMHVSNTKGMLYLGSSLNPPDAASTLIYAISKEDLIQDSLVSSSVRRIEINEMGHLTDITEDPATGMLWVSGFDIPEIPLWPPNYYIPERSWLSRKPFYEPRLAEISWDKWENEEPVDAKSLSDYSDPSFELALPLSLLWTGTPVNSTDPMVSAE